jgi:hypothetical protein
MKNAIFLSLLAIPLLFSCNKTSSDPSSYHLTASVDGSSKSFNTAVVAIRDSTAGSSIVQVTGILSPITGEAMNISITSGAKKVIVGTYSDNDPDFDVEVEYVANAGAIYFAGSTLSGSAVTNHLKLVITSMDATSIKGTFTGDFYLASIVPGSKKTITSGDFYAKFQ